MGSQDKVTGVNTGVQQQYLGNWMPALSDSIDYTSMNFMPSFGMSMGMANPMSMSGSIYGMGFGGKSFQDMYNMSYDQILTKQLDWAKKGIANNVAVGHAQKGAKYQEDAAETRVAKQIAVLRSVIHKNEQSRVQDEYDKLYNAVADMFIEQGAFGKESLNPNSPDYTTVKAKISSYTDRIYKEGTNGEILTDALEKHGDSEFFQGFKENFYFVDRFFNKGGLNYKDNLAHITGEEVTQSDKTYRTIGQVVGGVATVASLPLVLLGIAAIGRRGMPKYATAIRDITLSIFNPEKLKTIKAATKAARTAAKAAV